MRIVQLVAVTLMIIGSAAAGFTIWQIVDTTAAESELRGPAPILIGDAPPPAISTPAPTSGASATSTPRATAASGATEAPALPTATPVARNLAPATQPAATSPPQPTATALETGQPASGAVHSAARQPAPSNTVPAYLRIPRIDIEPLIVPVGLNERGEMASPVDYFQVGWWQFGAVPGDYGRAVLAGHVDTPTGEAVFYGIDRLAPGDEIFVGSEDSDRPELRFVVTGAALYHIDHAPVEQIFGPSTQRELILITCGGWYDHDAGEYLYRRVVFAKLAG